MDIQIRRFVIMMTGAILVTVIGIALSWMVQGDDGAREISALLSMAVGSAIGILIYLLIRRREPYVSPNVTCVKLRDVSTILSFLSVVPTSSAILIALLCPDFPSNEFPIISFIMIVVSMIVQAVFWRKVDAIGNMSSFDVISLFVLLICMNCSALVSIDAGGVMMLIASIIFSLCPIILMYDWQWSVDYSQIMVLIAAVLFTASSVMDGSFIWGWALLCWAPVLLLFLVRGALYVSFLMNQGQKIF